MALRNPISKFITTRRASQHVSRVRGHNTYQRELPQATTATREKTKQTHFGFQTVDEEEKWKKGLMLFITL